MIDELIKNLIIIAVLIAAVNTSFDGQGAPFLAGTSRSLSCFVDPPVMSATFIWLLGDSGSLVNTTTRVSIMNTSNASTLQFNPLHTSDGNRYLCRLMMIDGVSVNVTDEIYFNVTSKTIVQHTHAHTHTQHRYMQSHRHTHTHAHCISYHVLLNLQSLSAVSL